MEEILKEGFRYLFTAIISIGLTGAIFVYIKLTLIQDVLLEIKNLLEEIKQNTKQNTCDK